MQNFVHSLRAYVENFKKYCTSGYLLLVSTYIISAGQKKRNLASLQTIFVFTRIYRLKKLTTSNTVAA